MQTKYQIKSIAELKDFARQFIETHPNGAIVGLRGILGAGKTTFVRQIIELLSTEQKAPRVMSPSFVIHQRYDLSVRVDHLDLYRLEVADTASLNEIGYPDLIVERDRGFIFVEWPDRADFKELELDTLIEITLNEENRVILLETVGG